MLRLFWSGLHQGIQNLIILILVTFPTMNQKFKATMMSLNLKHNHWLIIKLLHFISP